MTWDRYHQLSLDIAGPHGSREQGQLSWSRFQASLSARHGHLMSFHSHFWEPPQKVNMCPSPHPFFSVPFCILTLGYDLGPSAKGLH